MRSGKNILGFSIRHFSVAVTDFAFVSFDRTRLNSITLNSNMIGEIWVYC